MQWVLSGEPRLLIGGVNVLLMSSSRGSKGLSSFCIDLYIPCLSRGAFSWVPMDREASSRPLCGLARVYMINRKAEEGARERKEEKPGVYIQDHTSYIYFCFFS